MSQKKLEFLTEIFSSFSGSRLQTIQSHSHEAFHASRLGIGPAKNRQSLSDAHQIQGQSPQIGFGADFLVLSGLNQAPVKTVFHALQKFRYFSESVLAPQRQIHGGIGHQAPFVGFGP